MQCVFCSERPMLLSISDLTGEPIHSHDFDNEGKPYYVCPECFSCDNSGLREDRKLIKFENERTNKYSRRDKQILIRMLCDKHEEDMSNKNKAVAEVMREIKGSTDKSCIAYISEYFGETAYKIEVLFYNIRIYRKIRGNGYGKKK